MGARIYGTCPSGKARFPNEVEGLIALANARTRRERLEKQGRRTFEHVEKRTYPCARCKGWHLTHLTEEEYEAKEAERKARWASDADAVRDPGRAGA